MDVRRIAFREKTVESQVETVVVIRGHENPREISLHSGISSVTLVRWPRYRQLRRYDALRENRAELTIQIDDQGRVEESVESEHFCNRSLNASFEVTTRFRNLEKAGQQHLEI